MRIASRRLVEFTRISLSSSAFAIIVKYNNILFKYLVVVPQYFSSVYFRPAFALLLQIARNDYPRPARLRCEGIRQRFGRGRRIYARSDSASTVQKGRSSASAGDSSLRRIALEMRRRRKQPGSFPVIRERPAVRNLRSGLAADLQSGQARLPRVFISKIHFFGCLHGGGACSPGPGFRCTERQMNDICAMICSVYDARSIRTTAEKRPSAAEKLHSPPFLAVVDRILQIPMPCSSSGTAPEK